MNLLNNNEINNIVSFPDEVDTMDLLQKQNISNFEKDNAVFHWILLLENTNKFDLTNTTVKTGFSLPFQEAAREETGFFNDNYDFTLSLPVKKTFRVKTRIKKVTHYQPKPFI
ncbi:hypothetical protein [Anaerophaga thermohalophila]|uniref:hypothetical protein n=1 Tax=Anaerophaga thermohalophila TaxID=177400 RepID=UPI0003182E75|nr:hypothetical protein [Anaerophaga thermohalophila]